MVDAFPLAWPPGWNRTQYPKHSNFAKHSMAKATIFLLGELKRLGAKHIVISTNVQLRRDGLPYSNRRSPTDAGVAVYFVLNGQNQCIPCDKWNRVECNLWAIAKCVEALRGLERWGAKEMVSASFQGFKALPEVASQPKVDYFAGCTTKEEVTARYRTLVKTYHPDHGGTNDQFVDLTNQYEIKRKEFL